MAGDIFAFHTWRGRREAHDWHQWVGAGSQGCRLTLVIIPQWTGQLPRHRTIQSKVSIVPKLRSFSKLSTEQRSAIISSQPHPWATPPRPSLSGQCISSGKDQRPPFLIFSLQMEKVECRAHHLASPISDSSFPFCSFPRAVPTWQPGTQWGRTRQICQLTGTEASVRPCPQPADWTETQLEGGWAHRERLGLRDISEKHPSPISTSRDQKMTIWLFPDLTTILYSEGKSQNSPLHTIIQQTLVSYPGMHSTNGLC